jgi:DNA helicase HerA-like ATPase
MAIRYHLFPWLNDEGVRYKILAHRDHTLSYFKDETMAGEILESLKRPWYRKFFKWPWLSWEIEANADKISYYFWTQNEHIGTEIRSKILGEHPEIEVFLDKDYMILKEGLHVKASTLRLNRDYPVMIKTFFNAVVDSQSNIVNSMLNLDRDEHVMVQVLMQPTSLKYQKYFDKAMDIVKSWDEETEYEKRELFQKSIYSKQSKLMAHCVIRLVSMSPDKLKANQLLQQLGRSFGQFSSEALNGFHMREPFFHLKPLLLSDWKKRRFPIFERKLKRTILNIEELSGIVRVPSKAINNSKLERFEMKNLEPPAQIIDVEKAVRDSNDLLNYIPLGSNTFRMKKTLIYLAVESLKRHLFVMGASGSGKSVFLQNICVDIAKLKAHGNKKIGFFLIDPHGEMSKKIVSALPDEILNDVNYIKPNPQDEEHFPMNVFDIDFKLTADSLSKNVANVLKRIWPDGWGVRPERNFLNGGIALSQIGEANILNINRLLSNPNYLNSVLTKIQDVPELEEVFDYFFELLQMMISKNPSMKRQHRELTDSTRNKLEQFSLSNLLSKTIGAYTSGFKWRTWMDEGKITILDLSAIQSEEERKMYGSMALTLNLQAAFSRHELIEKNEELSLYPIIVDELPTFIENNLTVVNEMADRTRFVGVPLIGAAQGIISQLPEQIAQAITRNFGSIISYQINNDDDAIFLEKFFNHEDLKAHDIKKTPENYAYMSLNIGRSKSRTFSALMNPPYSDVIDSARVEQLLKATLEKALEEEKEAIEKLKINRLEIDNVSFDDNEVSSESDNYSEDIHELVDEENVEVISDEDFTSDFQDGESNDDNETKSNDNLWDKLKD